MSGRSISLTLAFCLVLSACMSAQTPPTGKGAASPPTFATPADSSSPTPEPDPANPPLPQATSASLPAPDYAPRPGDEVLARAGVYLDSATLVVQGSSPAQFSLALKGNLPTPCHELRVKVDPPDTTNRIMLEVYSLTDPTKMCAEVLKPFEQEIDLGPFPTGHYSVFVNDRQVGEFDA